MTKIYEKGCSGVNFLFQFTTKIFWCLFGCSYSHFEIRKFKLETENNRKETENVAFCGIQKYFIN